MTAKTKKPTGRPRKLLVTPQVLRQVQAMAALGLTLEQIGLVLGISGRTVRVNKERDEALSSAYKKGKQEGLARVSKRLFEHAMGNSKSSLTACIFYLKTQGRWSEASVLRHEGPDGGPIRVENAQDQLAALLRRVAGQAEPSSQEPASSQPDSD